MSLNRTVLVGRLVRDVDLWYTPSGTAVANFTIACNRPFKSKDGDQEADFINIVVWRKPAENTAQYTKKGSLVGVDGRLQSRTYEQDGRTVYVTEVVADSVQFLDSKGSNNQNQQSNQQQSQGQSNPFQGAEPLDITDSDLPF